MVMHARKPQRIGDGYHFEKHQAHPYQVRREKSKKILNSKYSSSKSSYDRERMRERDSPNGNSYRSESPECDRDSPRDRDRISYHKTSSYISKSRDREYKSRDKYSDCVKSPKDKRSRIDSDHRTNHDRNSSEKMLLNSVKSQNSSRETSQRKLSSSCQDKRDSDRERDRDRDRGERVCRVGDWSEHVSSSGKKYYYNCKTEVSQWEKPREWMDRLNHSSMIDNSTRSHTRHAHSSTSSSSYLHHSSSSHPNSRTGGSNLGDKHSNSRAGGIASSKPLQQQSVSVQLVPQVPSQGMVPPVQGMVPPPQGMVPAPQCMVPPPQSMVPPPQGMVPPPQGMVPPPQGAQQVSQLVRPVPAPQAVPPPSGYWTTPHMIDSSSNDPRKTQDSLPNSNSGMVDGVGTDMEICSGDSTPTSETNYTGDNTNTHTHGINVVTSVCSSIITSHSLSTQLEGSVNTPGPPHTGPTTLSSALLSRVSPTSTQEQHRNDEHSTPPTPVHENQDCKVGSSLLAGSSLGAVRPQGPNLTPSLANHYRDDLVNHVRGWPADIIEKQAQKLSEEAYQLGTMCARVSAELKCPRSIVRQTEIQATRQEQRVLFLRQQIKTLEELKSQNSFMADET